MALAAFALMLGAAPVAGAPASSPARRIGAQTRLVDAGTVIALRQGYFKQEGLKVESPGAPDSADGREAPSPGPVDVRTISVRSFLVGVAAGAPLRATGPPRCTARD